MLPEGAGNYAGDPGRDIFRQTVINKVDPAAPTGVTIVKDFFDGPTAEELRVRRGLLRGLIEGLSQGRRLGCHPPGAPRGVGQDGAVRHIDDDERRARLARRHALPPGSRVADPVAATRAMTVLHATEPPTVYLSCGRGSTG